MKGGKIVDLLSAFMVGSRVFIQKFCIWNESGDFSEPILATYADMLSAINFTTPEKMVDEEEVEGERTKKDIFELMMKKRTSIVALEIGEIVTIIGRLDFLDWCYIHDSENICVPHLVMTIQDNTGKIRVHMKAGTIDAKKYLETTVKDERIEIGRYVILEGAKVKNYTGNSKQYAINKDRFLEMSRNTKIRSIVKPFTIQVPLFNNYHTCKKIEEVIVRLKDSPKDLFNYCEITVFGIVMEKLRDKPRECQEMNPPYSSFMHQGVVIMDENKSRMRVDFYDNKAMYVDKCKKGDLILVMNLRARVDEKSKMCSLIGIQYCSIFHEESSSALFQKHMAKQYEKLVAIRTKLEQTERNRKPLDKMVDEKPGVIFEKTPSQSRRNSALSNQINPSPSNPWSNRDKGSGKVEEEESMERVRRNQREFFVDEICQLEKNMLEELKQGEKKVVEVECKILQLSDDCKDYIYGSGNRVNYRVKMCLGHSLGDDDNNFQCIAWGNNFHRLFGSQADIVPVSFTTKNKGEADELIGKVKQKLIDGSKKIFSLSIYWKKAKNAKNIYRNINLLGIKKSWERQKT